MRLNRGSGPERVIDEVEKNNPYLFDNVDDVLGHDEREAIVKGYAGKAGFLVKKHGKKTASGKHANRLADNLRRVMG